MKSVEKIVLGTVQLGLNYGISNSLGKPSVETAIQVLDYAQNAGIRTVDTAQAYGSAMEVIGSYHRTHTSRFAVIGKFHLKTESMFGHVQSELEQLGIPHYEALLFHSFQDFEKATPAVFTELRDLRQNGYLRKIGLSVYTNDQFKQAIDHEAIEVIQLPFNVLDNMSHRGQLMALARQKGKELHVRSVFLQGLFFLEDQRVPKKLIPLIPYLKKIKEIARKYDITIGQLSLGYALTNQKIDKVLIGVLNEEQLEMNLQYAGIQNPLPPSAIEEIDNVIVKETDLLNPVNWK